MRKPIPKGILIPIGGAEDKRDKQDILHRALKETNKRRPKVCLITVATKYPKETAEEYKSAFRNIGIKEISVIYFRDRPDGDTKMNLKKIRECNVVLFSGGDQLRLSSLLGGTEILSLIKQRYYDEKGFVVAGTSAGAAAMSDTMIISGSSMHAMVKGELELTSGLDFINSVFIDTHFTERGRLGRLVQTVTANPGVLGVGLGEDTAMVIHKANELLVIGTGLVVIVDGTSIVYTDLTTRKDGEIVTVEGIKIHILGPGKRFCLVKKEIKNRHKK